MKTLPKIGYIALSNGYPVAAGFLRRVEGGYGQIDTLTTNRLAHPTVRNDGINKVVDALIQDAKDLRLHGILAITASDSIVDRGLQRGFSLIPQQIIGISLK